MRTRLNVDRLREIISASTLSQNHWAIRIGISRGHWSDIVNGKHPYPSPKTRLRLTEVLGVPSQELFTIESGPTTWHETDFRVALQDRYLVEQELGQGAMGAVYVALDVARQRRVAVKVLAPEAVCGVGPEAILREIGTVSRLQHPHILPLFDSGVVAEHPFFVMPWVRGGSLRDRLKQEGRIPLGDVVALTRGIAAALTHTHREFVLHCDVKPENVLLHGNHPWLADFGISRRLHAEVSEWRARKGLDVSAGTPAYVSPEQALGEELDGRTDVYSLGCVVFELLTGHTPFEGTTTEAVVARRFGGSTPRVTDLAPDIPHAVSDIVARAMQVERDRRPDTPDAFAAELTAAMQGATSFSARVRMPVSRVVGATRRWLARRAVRGPLDALLQDVRIAGRRMLRAPAISAFMLCTLALGIGVNVAAFSVVDRVLLRGPQHVLDPERLVRIYNRVEQTGIGSRTSAWLPHSAFATLQRSMTSIDGIAAYRVQDAVLGSGASSERRRISLGSSELFGVLGVQPIRGRFYGPDEDDSFVAVIGERYWRTALGADPAAIGSTIAVDDVAHQIVGVAPAGFTGPELGRVDVWTPIRTSARSSMNINAVARLKPASSRDAAVAELSGLRPELEAVLPPWAGWLRGAEYFAAPIQYDGEARPSVESVMATWLAAISVIILLISCANVANLMLARFARRRRELAVRVALGAGRARLMRLLAFEGILTAIGAAVLAIGVVVMVEPFVRGALFPTGAWEFTLLEGRVLVAIAGFTVLTGLLVSVAPALQAGDARLGDALRSGGGAGAMRSPLRAGLTVVQAALSVVLLVGAGLFLRSIQRVHAVDLGVDADRVLVIEARYPSVPRATGETFAAYRDRRVGVERARYRRLVEAARRVPGVEGATVMSGWVPYRGGVSQAIVVPGRDSIPALPGGGPWIVAAGEDYFATMGTAVREGRPFSASDREGSEPVAIVNAAMARTLWPARSAIGECIQVGSRSSPCARIVGVAADVHRNALREESSMQVYVPLGQEQGFSGASLMVRSTDSADPSWPALRLALQNADSEIRSLDVRVVSEGLAGEMRPFQLATAAFGLSALLALVVAGLGLYSVMAHAVEWRRHEIGVRMALGAEPGSIAALVVGRGAVLATSGIAAGLLIAFAVRGWVEPALFETSATDPLVLVGVVVVLEVVALLAGWIPARRALSVSPTEALRAE